MSFADVNDDGQQELILWQLPFQGGTQFWLPDVFDLKQSPPPPISFVPTDTFSMQMDYKGMWQETVLPDGKSGLEFVASAFPPCPLSISRQYEWKGEWLEPVATHYKVQPMADLQGYCELVLQHASQTWGADASVQLLEQLLPLWPPAVLANGEIPPPDAKDELIFQYGVSLALSGKPDEASKNLASLTSSNSQGLSRWEGPAIDFMAAYGDEKDIYKACLVSVVCNHRVALSRLVELLPNEIVDTPVEALRSFGVVIRSSGLFDFDSDGFSEHWFTIDPRPESRLEFWIIVKTNLGPRAVYVSTLDVNVPELKVTDSSRIPSVVQLDRYAVFNLHYLPITHEPYIEYFPLDYFWSIFLPETLDQAVTALLAGDDPSVIRISLLDVQSKQEFACSAGNVWCGRYFSLLGLTYELSGETDSAVANYLEVWRKHPSSPEAAFVRLKLSPKP